jgi:hypothetical protein
MKKLLIATLFTISQTVLATPEHFTQLKSVIDQLENSIIQEFSIDYPKDRENLTAKAHAKLATQIETKYGMQKTLFFMLEEKLYNIHTSLSAKVEKGKLSKAEAEKLETSIEYAKRIILKSRKAEINQIYNDFMAGLSHTPKLNDIYAKLNEMKVKNCSLSNLILDSKKGILSFDIKKKNKFGNWTSSKFNITNEDIHSGHLTSRLDNNDQFNPFQNIVTQYWNLHTPNSGHQKFTLLQDENGNIQTAEFNQESKEPLVSFLGMNFGSQKVTKEFECESLNKRSGPTPASVKNNQFKKNQFKNN